MHLQTDKSPRLDEIKTQFRAREGYYRLMNSPDYSQRSQRAMGFSTGTVNSNSSSSNHEKTCIKISLVTVDENGPNVIKAHRRSRGARDMKICFNVGRELFVYNYDGVRTGPDASNPIYKRFYKGSSPTCHDFNQTTASSQSICLLVGFSHGQVHLIDLNSCEDQESCKEFNVDRLIDKTRVTCIKWLPNSSNLFLVAHASGNLYLYRDDLPCGPAAPTYQIHKRSEGVIVSSCKTKTSRNPIYRWSIGSHTSESNLCSTSSGSLNSLHKSDNESCSLNEFVFSPCAKYLACVSQDGFLRVFCYDTMELVGRARSYYGGLTCVCWSPDSKYVVTGGEDDLITVWSFVDRRVVARGLGHKSWVSVVAFDSYYSGHDLNKNTDVDNYDDEDEDNREAGDRDIDDDEVDDEGDPETATGVIRGLRDMGLNANSKSPSNRSSHLFNNSACSNLSSNSHGEKSSAVLTTYRFGSVGQDTQLCLWDLSDDLLQQPVIKQKSMAPTDTHSLVNIASSPNMFRQNHHDDSTPEVSNGRDSKLGDSRAQESSNALKPSGSSIIKGSSFAKTFSLVGKRDKRNFRGADKNASSKNFSALNGDRMIVDPTKLLGSSVCPRMSEIPLIEPTVCKKISFERLTSLIFCQGGFITSCQDGYVFSWARPSRKSMRISPGQSNEELRVIDVGTSSAV